MSVVVVVVDDDDDEWPFSNLSSSPSTSTFSAIKVPNKIRSKFTVIINSPVQSVEASAPLRRFVILAPSINVMTYLLTYLIQYNHSVNDSKF